MTLARFGVLIPWGLIVLASLVLDGAAHGRLRGVVARLVPGAVVAAVAVWAKPWTLAPADLGLVLLSVAVAVAVAVPFTVRRLVPLLVAVELSLLAVGINPRAARDDRLPRPPLIERLAVAEVARPARIVGLGLMLPANLASRYSLRDLRASDPLRPAPFARLMGVLGEPPTVLGGPLDDLPPAVCGAWGVGYALTPPRRQLPGWVPVWSDRDGRVWSNPDLLEEVRVVGGVVSEPREPEALRAAVAEVDFATTALVRGPIEPISAAEIGVDVVHRTPTRVEAMVECDGPCMLVVAQPWAPGWRAMVGDERADIVLADVAGMGVRVPAGRHRVELSYHPWSWWPPSGWPEGVAID
jgi:hypothetical protein